jgi:hypothetical protein
MAQVAVAQQVSRLTLIERLLLGVPTLVGLTIGLFPLLVLKVFAAAAAHSDGSDL